jgi:hypothetical protein
MYLSLVNGSPMQQYNPCKNIAFKQGLTDLWVL